MQDKTFVTIDELAERTGLPGAWLKAEAKAERIPSLQTGRRLRFHLSSVERALLGRGQHNGKAVPA
jgi:excisionase family DNA binding protein